ncbi:hypothetical protein F5Y17DRAFT_477384 [Xylariaceae sp. FL0594]|nr:hypothetical protein F5Y17DRAFT_477384 [Xylariaceae sp. FL0594]
MPSQAPPSNTGSQGDSQPQSQSQSENQGSQQPQTQQQQPEKVSTKSGTKMLKKFFTGETRQPLRERVRLMRLRNKNKGKGAASIGSSSAGKSKSSNGKETSDVEEEEAEGHGVLGPLLALPGPIQTSQGQMKKRPGTPIPSPAVPPPSPTSGEIARMPSLRDVLPLLEGLKSIEYSPPTTAPLKAESKSTSFSLRSLKGKGKAESTTGEVKDPAAVMSTTAAKSRPRLTLSVILSDDVDADVYLDKRANDRRQQGVNGSSDRDRNSLKSSESTSSSWDKDAEMLDDDDIDDDYHYFRMLDANMRNFAQNNRIAVGADGSAPYSGPEGKGKGKGVQGRDESGSGNNMGVGQTQHSYFDVSAASSGSSCTGSGSGACTSPSTFSRSNSPSPLRQSWSADDFADFGDELDYQFEKARMEEAERERKHERERERTDEEEEH